MRCAAIKPCAWGRAARAKPQAAWGVIVLLLCPAVARAEVTLPQAEVNEPITITAQAGNRWQRGAYEVWLLRGNCRIVQGAAAAESNEAVLWIDREANQAGRGKIIAYLEGDATIDPNQNAQATRLTDKTWLGRFHTNGEIRVDAVRVAGEPDVKPGIYQRAVERRTPAPTDAIRRTQFITATDGPPTPKSLLSDTRRIRVFPRSNVPVQAQWFPDPHSDQWIAIVDSGVNMIVDGGKDVGSIDVSTDRLVIWTNGAEEPDLSGKTLQDEEIPLEIYMEGNIIFRQGDRVIYAKRMYYDVTNKVGTVIQAEILTPVQSYEGLLRLRAEVIRQTSPDRFFAENAYITSSRMGKPGYRIESGEIFFEDIQTPAFDPLSGEPLRDPVTHEPIIEHERTATASNNLLYIDDVPIFYWPTLATNLEDPTFYLRRARIKNDQVYGTQILTNWDAFQLLGYNDPPEGTDWDLSLDYLGRRGFGHGTTVMYDRDQFFGVPGPTAGLADFWGIGDHGTDNLGRGRRNLPPEQSYRYKLFWQHRQQLAGGLQLSAEVGWISDRNFLEEYFESEWDQLKDQTTG
ncbi:MAG: hypothetical protein HQ567_03845, partial [Candidatus Nealsonbacteria bacterium]|nr:hypothetical protein [Candidatus Nealsonbacteria bacterium]